jgi:hypothetical protein
MTKKEQQDDDEIRYWEALCGIYTPRKRDEPPVIVSHIFPKDTSVKPNETINQTVIIRIKRKSGEK